MCPHKEERNFKMKLRRRDTYRKISVDKENTIFTITMHQRNAGTKV